MKYLLTIAIALTLPEMAIASGTLNPLPIPSEPCRTVTIPQGTMSAPKLTQGLRVYPQVIRSADKSAVLRLCRDRLGSSAYLVETQNADEYLCVKEVNS